MKLAHQQDRGAVIRSRSGGDEALVRYAFFGCFATKKLSGIMATLASPPFLVSSGEGNEPFVRVRAWLARFSSLPRSSEKIRPSRNKRAGANRASDCERAAVGA